MRKWVHLNVNTILGLNAEELSVYFWLHALSFTYPNNVRIVKNMKVEEIADYAYVDALSPTWRRRQMAKTTRALAARGLLKITRKKGLRSTFELLTPAQEDFTEDSPTEEIAKENV